MTHAKHELQPIELWKVADLVPYERNAKKHPEEQIARLARVIDTHGWDQPIVLDRDGVIIKGHGRRLAALKLGLAKVPVIVRRDLSKSDADALRISDNAVASTAYDTKTLEEELRRLMAEDDLSFGVEALGLTQKDLDLLLKEVDTPDTDALIESTAAEFEAQKQEEREHVSSADAEPIPLSEAFGFKKIERRHARLVQRLMARAEEDTAREGADALASWLELMVDGGTL